MEFFIGEGEVAAHDGDGRGGHAVGVEECLVEDVPVEG